MAELAAEAVDWWAVSTFLPLWVSCSATAMPMFVRQAEIEIRFD